MEARSHVVVSEVPRKAPCHRGGRRPEKKKKEKKKRKTGEQKRCARGGRQQTPARLKVRHLTDLAIGTKWMRQHIGRNHSTMGHSGNETINQER